MSKKTTKIGRELFASDPANYHRCAEPRPRDEVARNVQQFFDRVSDLRNELRLADVYVMVNTPVLVPAEEGGGVVTVHSSTHYGSAMNAAPMTAFAAGQERQRLDRLMEHFAQQGERQPD